MKIVSYQSNYEYNKFLFERTVTSYEVIYIYGNSFSFQNPILKFFFRICHSSFLNKYWNLPFKKVWFQYMIPPNIGNEDNVCFLFNSTRVAKMNTKFYEYLRSHYKHCKLVLQLSNPISPQKESYIYEMIKIMDMISTYNAIDAKKYNIHLCPHVLYKLEGIKKKLLSNREIDFLFVGQDKGRLDTIKNLYKILNKYGAKCNFNIVGTSQEGIIDGIHYCSWIPYHNLVALTENTKCIINILQEGNSGVTVRDVEAYNFGCFIMSNNETAELKEIFNSGQYIDINNVDANIVKYVQNRKEPFPMKENNYTLDSYYNWIENTIF